ncbi:hypothetical protein G3N59_10460 [Paraburkholderia sp. Ac-20340]|uniref:hypothetical protein n=1 Tax=Paraburkholderia sp. Ac-20340 TaxID=2703888 RepID=UPI00197D6093|nr:hypothetical protein [Paraburkholderia sp. Ac-20340]MBN3853802.1 hypothetical protein [Paraburkholderia sp. Ac-20340]
MNLRILKKLSKRAAPLLPLLGDCREQFRAERDGSHTGQAGIERKHWDRTSVSHGGKPWRHDIKFKVRRGERWVVMSPPSSPLKGTVIVGEMSGYYEPEWDEETAWESLERIVLDHFTDWDESGPTALRRFRYPSDIFRAAREIIAERGQ